MTENRCDKCMYNNGMYDEDKVMCGHYNAPILLSDTPCDYRKPMTDKMTPEQALKYFKHRITCYGQCGRATKQRQAFEVAIETLEQNAELKSIIEDWYLDKRDISARIDGIACGHCGHKVNGACELPDSEKCAQTGEEALELFWKHGLGE